MALKAIANLYSHVGITKESVHVPISSILHVTNVSVHFKPFYSGPIFWSSPDLVDTGVMLQPQQDDSSV